MQVVETISDDTLIFLQTHKRIWPASQRDCLFWSHIRKIPNDQDRDEPDMWAVVNHSTELGEYPVSTHIKLFYLLIYFYLFDLVGKCRKMCKTFRYCVFVMSNKN